MPVLVVPLESDKMDEWKAWTKELDGTRRAEFDAFNQRMGLTVHRAWLVSTPNGPMVVALQEGPGADAFMQKLATSKEPFDGWFRSNLTKFHHIDFASPAPKEQPQLLVDWHAQKAHV